MSEIEKAAKEYADRFFKSKEDCFKAGAAWKDAKVEKLVDCVKEILEILDDHEARKQMDSFTGQPLQIALAEYEGKP